MELKTTRYVDDLGRVVLPMDMRKHYGIKSETAVEIIAIKEGILIKSPSAVNEAQKGG